MPLLDFSHTWTARIGAATATFSMLAGLVAVQPQTVSAASNYSTSVLADSPQAYWRFAETAGSTAADASGKGHTANLLGVSGGGASPLVGDTDTAFLFNGNASVKDRTTLTVGANFAIEAWVKPTTAGVSAPVVSVGVSSGTRTLYYDAGRFRGMADMSANWPAYSVFSAPVDGSRWHHVVFVTQGTALRLYVDGVLSGSSTMAARPGFTAPAVIGWSDATWLPHFNGTIDEVAVYSTALSAARISAHYTAGINQAAPPPPPPAPVCSTTLQSLVNAAPSGASLSVPACVYRETVTLSRPITLTGQSGAEIRGSDVWSTWSAQGATWLSQLAVPPLPVVSLDPNACTTGTNNRCLWPEQVFVDGLPLAPVAAGAAPGPGQFALVSSSDRHIRLGDNPSGRKVEVTTRARWIVTAANNVTISNFTMLHAGSSAVVGAISNDGHSNWTLQDSRLSDAHSTNARTDGGASVRLLRNDIARAGLEGVAGTLIAQGGLIQGNRIHNNGLGYFSRDWGAAGLKLTEVQNFVVDGNEADHNGGIGLWCDISCKDATFSNNRVHHNQWQGIEFEISDGAKIFSNAVWENGWGNVSWGWGAGIVISSSANAEVYGNTIAWNDGGISVLIQSRPDAVNPVGNYVHDNVIIKKTITGDFSETYWRNLSVAWLSDGSRPLYDASYNNHALNNRVWYDLPEDMSVRFTWTDQYRFVSDFGTLPGGTGTSYLSTTAMNQALTARAMPLAPEAH